MSKILTWVHSQAEVEWNNVRKKNSGFKLEFKWNVRLVDDGHVGGGEVVDAGVVGVDAVHRREVLHPAGAEDAEMDQGPAFGPRFGANKPRILIFVMVNQSVEVDDFTKILIIHRVFQGF